jgi:hypothetical protein
MGEPFRSDSLVESGLFRFIEPIEVDDKTSLRNQYHLRILDCATDAIDLLLARFRTVLSINPYLSSMTLLCNGIHAKMTFLPGSALGLHGEADLLQASVAV